ncbi:MAG: hypothetical protein AUG03_07350 [Acidobacteria bacterium 13_1_20CM_2_68_14]|nr:MAG: hypothetical protein AUG03_07350 [Acidobacteria bacterium 13_1_20CM_2_68_14]
MLNLRLRDLRLLTLVGSLTLAGCGSVAAWLGIDTADSVRPPSAATAAPPATAALPAEAAPPTTITAVTPEATETTGAADGGPASAAVSSAQPPANSPAALARAEPEVSSDHSEIAEDYDPWEGFNQKMFAFNRGLDKHVIKPVAKAYDVVMPEPFQQMIGRAFENLRWPARFVNNLLQKKWGGAGREVARFLINSIAGIGGLWDPAKDYWGIEPSNADFGQTLGKWGVGSGPYLVLPLLPPLTIRDGIGMGVDTATSPLGYYTPWAGPKAGDTVNDRSLNIDLYQGFEESVVDMYSAVRNAYLRKREQKLRE